ncbi:methyltransferase domain-containing protein [Campylobacter troglodytis]|uniref:methyltransferase domain-containing protein n=1 Tax=Campylobacter troglodytis TaxID=654363 RepID=UPI00249DF5BB|nr:methyltransferase domain-containing protein [Campylobacter troglodytis]
MTTSTQLANPQSHQKSQLAKPKLLEIAPGSGDLLVSLAPECDFIYTIDPSLVSLEVQNIRHHKHIQAFFDEKIATQIDHDIDLIVFRHLLEHIENAGEFLRAVVQIAAPQALIYIEVPNTPEFLGTLRFYELFNDHCGYHQKGVLCDFMAKLSCECVGEILLYNEQHLGLFFVKNAKFLASARKKFTQKSEVIFYDERLGKALNDKACELNTLLKSYSKVALYGAGAHGNTIITYLDSANLDKIALCFDLDTRKQGRFLQGSKIIIKKPCKAEFTGLECILISSPLYEKEICEFLRKEGFMDNIITSEGIL